MSENDQSAAAGEPERRREEGSREQGERARQGRGERRPGGRGRGGRHGQPSQPQHQRRAEPSLNMEELRELAELFTTHGLTDFEFENEDIRLRLSRNAAPQTAAPPQAPAAAPPATHATAPPAAPAAEPSGAATSAASGTAPAEERAEDLHTITSPIVGTFYRASAPTAEPFVRVGSHVDHDTVVCIIEAMKLMNEIQAETAGTVEKIYVENGQPVEFGQPLFGIKK